MSTFAVTTTPSQLYLGGQETVTIYNNGPVTIYIDSIPGVSSLNGFALSPTAQMTWKSKTPLWAVTSNGTATVITSTAGDLSVTARGNFWTLLDNTQQNVVNTAVNVSIECGFAATLLIKAVYGGMGTNTGAQNTLTVTWQDVLGNTLSVDSYNANVLDSANPSYFYIPVKGFQAQINLTCPPSGGTAYIKSVQTYGTSLVLPYRNYTDGDSAIVPVGGVITRSVNSILASASTPTSGQDLYFPALGNHVQITLRTTAAVTTAGTLIFFYPAVSGVIPISVALPTSATSEVVTASIDLPIGVALAALWSPVPVIANAQCNIGLVYSDI